MIDLNDEKIMDIVYDSWHIPIGIFDSDGTLQKLFFAGGERQTQFYLEDSASVLQKESGAGTPVLRFDIKGSCWCLIPIEVQYLLFGPVQTGRNPAYPYEGVPEHTWNGFREIARCLISLLLGKEIPLIEKQETYTEEHTIRQMLRTDREKNALNSFDEIYDCVRRGDLKQLESLLGSGEFAAYLDRVMGNMSDARTVFQFNLAKTHHSAQDASVALQDLALLVNLYLTEEKKYRSLAAYKAGMHRMLYDFTRYVSQFRDGRHTPLVNKAQLYINENLYTQISVDEIAKHCMVSISTLQHRFKEETGMSVTDMIRTKKVEKAGFFLKHTNISCGDIAYRMGYGSQSFFIRQFRKVTGITPMEYRTK